ncbi:MAG: hypothetical protein EAZ97_14390 [Bacteroidetes bacterium]|nr:MAG: hypothetical protein EAZ97_14390 [Bacteroidota bacterium]
MKFFTITFIFMFLCVFSAQAQRIIYEDGRIIVGVKIDPPFIMKDIDGSFYGVSIDLWVHASDDMGIKFEFQEFTDTWEMIRALKFNEIDISINPWPISATYLHQFEVSQPFYISTLGIATPKSARNQFQMFINNFFSFSFLKIIFFISSLLFVSGMLIWLAERDHNKAEFRYGWNGLFDGFWWSAVTMATVGYGDKTPITFWGRFLAMVWMLSTIVLISTLTATISSTLTLNSLESTLERPEDMRNIRKIGTVSGSASEDYLVAHGIEPTSYDTPMKGLRAVSQEKIDIFVYDRAVMNYLLTEHRMDGDVKILPITFNKQYRCFLMPKESHLVNKLNPEIIDRINVSAWQRTLEKYNLREDIQ